MEVLQARVSKGKAVAVDTTRTTWSSMETLDSGSTEHSNEQARARGLTTTVNCHALDSSRSSGATPDVTWCRKRVGAQKRCAERIDLQPHCHQEVLRSGSSSADLTHLCYLYVVGHIFPDLDFTCFEKWRLSSSWIAVRRVTSHTAYIAMRL